MEEKLVGEFPRPTRLHPEETCRVALREDDGNRSVEIYPRFRGIDGEWKSGAGMVFRREELDALLSALGRAAALLNGTSGRVRRDEYGAIVNAEELTCAEVKHQPVLCPACRKKVFKKWPEGWDGHAGFRCEGVSGTEAERKAAFRERFRHLFVRQDPA